MPGWSVCKTVSKEGIPRHFPSQQIAPGEQAEGSTEQIPPAVSVKEGDEREQERSSWVRGSGGAFVELCGKQWNPVNLVLSPSPAAVEKGQQEWSSGQCEDTWQVEKPTSWLPDSKLLS